MKTRAKSDRLMVTRNAKQPKLQAKKNGKKTDMVRARSKSPRSKNAQTKSPRNGNAKKPQSKTVQKKKNDNVKKTTTTTTQDVGKKKIAPKIPSVDTTSSDVNDEADADDLKVVKLADGDDESVDDTDTDKTTPAQSQANGF